jgi:predicted helicase
VPKSNPFLRQFFDHIAGANFDKSLGYIVDELCEVFAASNIHEIVHKHLGITGEDSTDKDPIIHFYEDFLQEYDSKLKKAMGAYYTPVPVVRYIVRQVDKILKEQFDIIEGLASRDTITRIVDAQGYKKHGGTKLYTTKEVTEPRVQILDPAVGTATFLNEIIKYIYNTSYASQPGLWQAYANDNLIKRLFGFELMMAPYTIAHLKLGITLAELGAKDFKDRLGVYLTNTLEEGIPVQQDLLSLGGLVGAVTEESDAAAEIKSNAPIMTVIGNPPYSGVSSNETDYANSLIKKYKVEPGGTQKLQERKHWLNDDYVKFIAFAEDMIERNGQGIVAMITNNGYLENPTFRGMRWRLAQTFDEIYCLDLHGNAKKKETDPDGGKDENVFDIMQGVSIILAIKTSKSTSLAKVYHAEVYGKRQHKFDELNEPSFKFNPIELDPKMYYFVPKNTEGKEEYDRGVALNELMPINTTGIVTARDSVVIDESKENLLKRIEKFVDPQYSDDDIRHWLFPNKKDGKYKAGDSRGWKLSEARKKIRNNDHESLIVPIAYRPFDVREIYYSPDMVDWGREKITKHMLLNSTPPEGIVMIFRRQQPHTFPFSSIFVADSMISDGVIRSDPNGGESMAPLYTYKKEAPHNVGVVFERSVTEDTLATDAMPEHAMLGTAGFAGQFAPLFVMDDGRGHRANFNPDKFRELFSEVEQPNENTKKVYPEDVFDYIYASLHSPAYREKYKEFLRANFPRVPRPANWAEFWRLVEFGRELRNLHLVKGDIPLTTSYHGEGEDNVEKIERKDEKIYINERKYFDGVTDIAWNFHIGGYQPAQKWLKDRKGQTLTTGQLIHYQKIITILTETNRIMQEIDKT